MAKICLLTPGQPSINPRLVKEADALVEAGHEVHVLCSHYVAWADEADRALLSIRPWTCTYVGGDQESIRYLWTRLRHGVTRRALAAWNLSSIFRKWALCRVSPELLRAASDIGADLYIAHYSGALVAAAVAARRKHALLAFDAEDFESGYYNYETVPSVMDRLTELVERQYLPTCCYVTAASPGIAQAYRSKYAIPDPTTVLNVFPLAERPQQSGRTNPAGSLQLYWFSQTIGLGRGLEDVIRAMGKLKDCEIELHMRGRWSPNHRVMLLGLAGRAGVDVRRIFSYSPEPSGEMVRLSAMHDIGLAIEPSDSENHDLCISNKIFTYLLAGNAIIATSTRGQRPIMETIGEAGFLYEPGDVDALARGLRLWYQDRSLVQQARCKSWLWGTKQFNWDLEKKKLLQVVERALSKEMRAKSACG